MEAHLGAVVRLAEKQHRTLATWQLRALGWRKPAIAAFTRRLTRVYRGVYCLDPVPTHLGAVMAAVLAQGPGAALSHISALRLRGLRPWEADVLHVAAPGRGTRTQRDGIVVHRPRRTFSVERVDGIPMTSVTRALCDARLERHALYRALEEAHRQWMAVDHDRLPRDIVDLYRRVRGHTLSDAEAAFLLLCDDHRLPLPLVNHSLNGILTDFHWPGARLVVEVDGWEFHKERHQFEEDRRRALIHAAAGFTVVRPSATHVFAAPGLVLAAVAPALGR